MKEILQQLYQYNPLHYKQAREVLTKIASGQYNQAQIASFLTVYIMRGPTVDELSGFRDALLDLCIRLDFSDFETIDLCGTGGDGKQTFNISTLAALVVAGAGVKVAKHGNYGVSSISGSSNVLERLGYRFRSEESQLRRELDEAGICFLHAPLFHPAMKTVAPIRRELGVKTFFNMLGPMVNPSFPNHQLVGVFDLKLARMYQYIYQSAQKSASIVHNLDGYDECTLTAPTRLLKTDSEDLLQASDFGLPPCNESELSAGNSIEEAAALFKNILNGRGTQAQHAVVAANAGLALQHYFDESLQDSVLRATESLQAGHANKVFQKLLSINP